MAATEFDVTMNITAQHAGPDDGDGAANRSAIASARARPAATRRMRRDRLCDVRHQRPRQGAGLLRRPVRGDRRRAADGAPSGFTLYGRGWGQPGVAITPPNNGEPATAGNGNMVSLVMDSRDRVDALHAKALELGGSDEGPPGVRGEEGERAFYGGLFPRPRGEQVLRLLRRAGMSEAGAERLKIRVIINRGGGSFGEDKRGPAPAAVRGAGHRGEDPGGRAGRARPPLRRGGGGGGRRRGRRGRRRRHDRAAPPAASPGPAMPLGILPLGTLNHLARDAGIPLDLEEAAEVIAAGHIRADRRRRGQRPGLHQQQLGRPLSRAWSGSREAEQERTGRSKRLAMLSASLPRLLALLAATGSGSASPGWRRRSTRLCCSSATIATR